jgi:hypothetical protein
MNKRAKKRGRGSRKDRNAKRATAFHLKRLQGDHADDLLPTIPEALDDELGTFTADLVEKTVVDHVEKTAADVVEKTATMEEEEASPVDELSPVEELSAPVSVAHKNPWTPAEDGSSTSEMAGRAAKLRRPWTAEEDTQLRTGVAMHGARPWKRIAEEIDGRDRSTCWDRWHNHLDPTINKGPWTTEEDRVLLAAHKKLGNRWKEIYQRRAHAVQRGPDIIRLLADPTLGMINLRSGNNSPRPISGQAEMDHAEAVILGEAAPDRRWLPPAENVAEGFAGK